MAGKSRSVEAVHFRGWPDRLTGAVELPTSGPISLTVSLDLPKRAAAPGGPFYAQPIDPPAGRESWLSLSLPTTTLPGAYRGTIQVGDQIHIATFEVEPRLYLRLIPGSLVVRGQAGARVTAQLTLVNLGNVAFEVRRVHAFGVSELDGLERAFGQTFRARLSPGERRIDRFADALAEAHGGLVRVQIAKGAGSVAPGDSRELTAMFKLPDRMHSGRDYAGTWPLGHVRYGVQIDTTIGVPSREHENEHEAEDEDEKE
jgi:hypothetical protein